ncbi:hypothetical protein AMAG_19630 [Allomyces macrogynus ATCC 38327]|uniref:Cytochrome P450 n=1 Tax=Allomyces macrogynus (strain ATCC 38327) TaxID=578462 RepID=A0A0L0SYW0_ALLM3|nr:hypothetical protein AMAG_19630 [Allomyces macrogynus ATCC 38327]|eukprot:KNE67489.1 hypothetical protein AMAG_19630 [Allomyces macrogynus ATCC 38327]
MMIRSRAALMYCARAAAICTVRVPVVATSTNIGIRTKATAVGTANASTCSKLPPPDLSARADPAAAPAPKPFEAIPRVPTLPVLGAALEFARLEPKNTGQKFHEVVKKLSAKYGPIVRVRMPGEARDTVLITDADMVAEVLRAEGPIPRRRHVPTWEYYRKQNGLPMGLVLDDGEDWKRLRSAVQTPIFPPKNAHNYCSAINPATAQAMEVIKEGLRRAGPRTLAGEDLFAMEEITMRWSLEAVTTIILGQRLGALDAEPNPLALEMIRANNTAVNTTGPVFIMPEFVWRNQLTPAAREHFEAIKTITDLATRIMNTTLTECAKDPAKLHGTFLGHVLQRDATITRDEMLATAVDLLFAGIDTTARSLLNIMNLLGRHPDMQAKLRDEINAVVGTDPAVAVNATHLAQFKYLKNVIKEAMRLYMIVPVNARILPRDAVVGGHLLPQGSEVLLGSQAIAHKAKYFADPLTFNPDRWESKDIHPFASLQFGFGPRMCVGRRIAEMEMSVFLAHLLRRFEIMPAHAPKEMLYNVLLSSAGPMPLKFRPLSAMMASTL